VDAPAGSPRQRQVGPDPARIAKRMRRICECYAGIVGEPESAGRHPTSALLVVEVSASSHAIDRGRKAELYAAAGIPAYWLIDIPARTVEVRSDPGPSGYRTLRTLDTADVLASPCQGVEELALDELLKGI
jgi:Uma2 family endonuclease